MKGHTMNGKSGHILACVVVLLFLGGLRAAERIVGSRPARSHRRPDRDAEARSSACGSRGERNCRNAVCAHNCWIPGVGQSDPRRAARG